MYIIFKNNHNIIYVVCNIITTNTCLNYRISRMDSIDVYLEKKRKRMEGFNQSVKRAKVREQDKETQNIMQSWFSQWYMLTKSLWLFWSHG